jgi:SAM-dependent methyltransferase
LIVGDAVDLGCGDGRDTVELLRRNWRVLAIDGEAEAIARLRQRPDVNRTYLETRVQTFESLVLPPNVDLINASFCLPFCPPAHFVEMWEEVINALRSGGRFCGQLFGDRDSWAAYGDVSTYDQEQVRALLSPFEIELLDEEEHLGKTALGDEKHWHLFHVVARKH